jgi:hypothetical protein
MRPYRERFKEQGLFFAFQSWAGCITNIFGFDLRQAQRSQSRRIRRAAASRRPVTATIHRQTRKPCNYAMSLNSAVLENDSGLIASIPGTTNKMMGWGTAGGGNCHITPTYSTRIEVEFTGLMSESSGGSLSLQTQWGTGTAPANSAASTGSAVGSSVGVNGSGTTGISAPFKIGGIITGLTTGVAVWFDALETFAGSASLSSLSCCAHEVL